MATKVVVITGSTRGIGLGLAREFITRGCRVVISGRNQADVDRIVALLEAEIASANILGQACDITQYDQVQSLWDAAITRYGHIDIWINNAGIGHTSLPFWEQDVKTIDEVLQVNIQGVMYGSRIAIKGMLSQGWGHLYNMEGLGSDGRMLAGQTIYGTSKRALAYFTKALAKEVRNTEVKVSALSPGMVVTDLLVGNTDTTAASFQKAKNIFNILADRVETVTPWLVNRMLANKKNGRHISWLTNGKIVRRFLWAPFSKRDVFYKE